MSLLNDQEIDALWLDEPNIPQKVKRRELVRISQVAVIKKLATVSVEPVALARHDPNMHMVGPNDGGMRSIDRLSTIPDNTHLYTAEALAAARVQALEEAAIVCDSEPEEATGECGAYEATPYACGCAIRALIGETK